jgi:hypothetical protein
MEIHLSPFRKEDWFLLLVLPVPGRGAIAGRLLAGGRPKGPGHSHRVDLYQGGGPLFFVGPDLVPDGRAFLEGLLAFDLT